jgi:hypothetical protein
MMETAPAASFKMVEPDLLLKLLIIPLDAPAQFGEIDKTAKSNVVRQARKPVFCGLLFFLGPCDHEPFFRPGFATIVPVSSMIQASIGPCRSIAGSTISRTFASTFSSDQRPSPAKCSSD